MKRTSLTLMLFGFIAAFLTSALILLRWLAFLRSVAATHLADSSPFIGPRLLFAAFLISFSVGTALLIRWLYWKRRFRQQLP